MSSNVLQEYLIRLGYQVDAIGFRRFDQNLTGASKRIFQVGAGITGIVAATGAASAAFAYNMRKMYFTSELANSTVKNLKGMEYAAEQVGISGDSMTGSIQAMAQQLRLFPNLATYLNNMGIETAGKTTDEILLGLVNRLKELQATQGMTQATAAGIASLFGISEEDYHQMALHADVMKGKVDELDATWKKLNINMEENKDTITDYTARLSKLGMIAEAVGTKFLTYIAPWFNEKIKTSEEFLGGISRGVDSGFNDKWWHSNIFTGEDKSKQAQNVKNQTNDFIKKGTEGAASYLKKVSSQYGLPENFMYKVFGIESAYGSQLNSSAGAQGPFQFMPGTAKDMGLKNPYDFEESANASAKMYARLSKKYNGDLGLASGAYNWGEGNIDSWLKTGKGIKGQAMPEETRLYMQKLGTDGSQSSNQTITNNNTFNITGNDSKQIADSVAQKQDRVNANTARQMQVIHK
jgi:hypothetical protein